jgi:hypothetical protein
VHKPSREYLTIIGFIFCVFSWATWIISGSLSFNPHYASIWLAMTIAILTVWLIIYIIVPGTLPTSSTGGPQGSSPGITERARWFVFNVLYIGFLVWFGPLGGGDWLLIPLFLVLLLLRIQRSADRPRRL